MYVGKGVKEVVFVSIDIGILVKFYYNCVFVYMMYFIKKVILDEVFLVTLGDNFISNCCMINKYFVLDVLEIC